MAEMIIRFNPRLTKQQMDKVKKSAKEKKVSWAQIIRDLINKYL